ncbi:MULTISPECIES: hypothetical protein [Mycobacterium]|nr:MULTISPECIES: hypothetical protein [Mycobacterium]
MLKAHSIQVHTCHATGGVAGVATMTVFLEPTLFPTFGLPPDR